MGKCEQQKEIPEDFLPTTQYSNTPRLHVNKVELEAVQKGSEDDFVLAIVFAIVLAIENRVVFDRDQRNPRHRGTISTRIARGITARTLSGRGLTTARLGYQGVSEQSRDYRERCPRTTPGQPLPVVAAQTDSPKSQTSLCSAQSRLHPVPPLDMVKKLRRPRTHACATDTRSHLCNHGGSHAHAAPCRIGTTLNRRAPYAGAPRQYPTQRGTLPVGKSGVQERYSTSQAMVVDPGQHA